MAKQMKENIPYCAKCNKEMQEILLPKYEYEQGSLLHNVGAFRCNACNNIFFTESQAKEMKARASELKEYLFSFERKIMVSGKSLVIGIPHELAEQFHMKQGQKIKIFPIANEGLIIKKSK